jgi:subtilisin family serine protease
LDNSYTYPNTAPNVHAYIIDTGILITHTDFGGRASVGTDTVGDGYNGIDCNGHGTHVAGTVGGATYGVAKGVTLLAVRVLNCAGSGTYSGVIAGIDWVTANAIKPAVANMSLGGGFSQAMNDAVTRSMNSGVTYAIAAGNSSADACGYSPASTPGALTVGATDSSDNEAYFSNYGTCLALYAPGVDITSDWNSSTTATNTISGTSMASPHVAGAAALYLSVNPAASAADVLSALVANATPGVVVGASPGSPNLLLFVS